MADKIREIQERFKGNYQDGDQLSAAIAYVPLIGWILPYRLKQEDALCQYHGRQGMRLNILMLCIYFTIWILENFPLTSWLFGQGEPLNALTSSFWIITLILYVIASGMAAYRAFMDEEWEVPYLEDIIDMLEKSLLGKKDSKD